MLAPEGNSRALDETVLLESLRAGAFTVLQPKKRVYWKFGRLVSSCRADLGMSSYDLRFLLNGYEFDDIDKAVRATYRDWNERLRRLPPPSAHRPRIALLVSDGQAIRTFVQTDVCRQLAAWAELYVLSPHNIEADVAKLGPDAHFLPIPMIRRMRLDNLVGHMGFRLTGSPTNARMVERLNENLDKAIANGDQIGGSLLIWKISQDYRTIDDYVNVYRSNLKLFSAIYSLKSVAKLLRRLQPDLVLNTSIISWPSRLWTRAAALNGTPILSYVISWDNMSTKTLLDEFVETFLIWSEEMDEDFTTSVPFVREKPRVIVGSPQFEPILQGTGLVSKETFLADYGLDPRKKLVLYTTGSKTNFPAEAECLDHVLSHWRDNLKDDVEIMVRMHPKDRQGRYEEVIEKFPDVPFTLAGDTLEYGTEWVPNADDVALLVNQLHHCDVIINCASTMTLEGFVIDKPSINIGFNLGVTHSLRYPMSDYYRSRHYHDIVESGAAKLVGNYEELFAALDQILNQGDIDAQTQRAILLKKCRFYEDSSARLSAFVKSYCEDLLPQREPALPAQRKSWLSGLFTSG